MLLKIPTKHLWTTDNLKKEYNLYVECELNQLRGKPSVTFHSLPQKPRTTITINLGSPFPMVFPFRMLIRVSERNESCLPSLFFSHGNG
ncbi:unnamed protein product, partial [Larinioides sclopetarius]